MNNFFLCLIVIHFINDFLIQSNQLVEEKKAKNLKYHIYHTSIQGIASFIFLLMNKINLFSSIFIFLILLTSHLLIDFTKVNLDSKTFNLKEGSILKLKDLSLFLLDQIIHIRIIYILCNFFLSSNKINKDLFYFLNKQHILIILFYILGTYFSSVLIVKILDLVYYPDKDYKNKFKNIENKNINLDAKVGKYIGILERSFVLIVYFFSNDLKISLSAITVLLAIKSITRFKLLETKEFAEYYLLGSLLSYTCVLINIIIYSLY